MKLYYEIYGCTLKLEFQNDLLLLEHLKNHVGKIVEQDDAENTDASIIFKKSSAFDLEKMYEHFVFDTKRNVFVEPTCEQAIVGYSNNDGTIVHFYNEYYLVVFYLEKKEVVFNYSDNFFNIDYLLMEFFKYCIFPIKMTDGWLPLHSSCVLSKKTGKTILFVGDSGCGKSSNALLMSLNFNYYFCNDEVTYLTYNDGKFLVNPTGDKVKICQEMYSSLLEKNIEFVAAQLESEFVCDVSSMRRNDYNFSKEHNLPIDIIFFLKRDDSKCNIQIYQPDVIEKYRCLIENCNMSVWTNREHKRMIMNMVDKIIKEVNILSFIYPTNEINNISNKIEEKYDEYNN